MPIHFSEVVALAQDSITLRTTTITWQDHPITVKYKFGLITPAKMAEMRLLSAAGDYTSFNLEYLKSIAQDWDVMLDTDTPYPLPAHAGRDGLLVQGAREALVRDGRPPTPALVATLLPDDACVPELESLPEGADDEAQKQYLATQVQARAQRIRDVIEMLDAINRLPPPFIKAVADGIAEDARPKVASGGSFSDS